MNSHTQSSSYLFTSHTIARRTRECMTHASRSYTRVRRATEDVRILYSMSENKHVDKANYLIESLCNVVVPAFKLEFANVYDRVKARSPPEFVIRNFQEELERAPDRTVEQGRDMLELIVSVHACPWLAGLLNDIVDEFRSLIGYTGTVAITPEAFLNNCYRNIARDLWKRPYLLFDKFDRYECCKNKSIYDGIVKYAVVGTVSEIIPIEKIHSSQIETVIDGEAAGDACEDDAANDRIECANDRIECDNDRSECDINDDSFTVNSSEVEDEVHTTAFSEISDSDDDASLFSVKTDAS